MCFLIPHTRRMCCTWEVDEHLRTNASHIFAGGDVVDRETESQMAGPLGSHDDGIAARNALSKEKPHLVDRRMIPPGIFTDPQIGIIGLSEQQATEAGHCCWCNTSPMSAANKPGWTSARTQLSEYSQT
jgi:pyruvate/2-oxoglutarate dehydrogenase complex dihydrolipoamide dehydrogenase (E3) component